jgi:hypothetical protein
VYDLIKHDDSCFLTSLFKAFQNKDEIEKVQRRAARFVTGRYHNTSSVSSMIDHLNWESFEQRRQKVRVIMLLKIPN